MDIERVGHWLTGLLLQFSVFPGVRPCLGIPNLRMTTTEEKRCSLPPLGPLHSQEMHPKLKMTSWTFLEILKSMTHKRSFVIKEVGKESKVI